MRNRTDRHGLNPKLDRIWQGPAEILRTGSKNTYFVNLNGTEVILSLGRRFAAFEEIFEPLCFPSNLTLKLMVEDILGDTGVIVEVWTLGVMKEGGSDNILLGYMGLTLVESQIPGF